MRDEARANVAGSGGRFPRAPMAPHLGHLHPDGEGLVEVFIVLYVVDVLGFSAAAFGALVAVQATTSIASYLAPPASPTVSDGSRS